MASSSVTAPDRVAGRTAPTWQQTTVTEVIDEAPDADTVRLQPEESGGFLPGQYDNVRLEVAGRQRPVQRAYSVGSSPAPDPSVIDLGVREVPGGPLSPRLVGLRASQRLGVRGPDRLFAWTGEEAGTVLLVGTRSGLVPLMSMVRDALHRGRSDPVWLIYSTATYDHAFYRDELAGLADMHRWLWLVHCISRDPTEERADYHRWVDKAVLSECLGETRPARAHMCGPSAMVESIAAALVGPAVIATERYD